jgi:hypothetical protein
MLALLAPLLSLAPSLPPVNLTLYHVNPAPLGAKPTNMNTADVVGDMFFDWHNVIFQPLSCPKGKASGHGCSNPEAVAKDLVVNKVVLEVDPAFSGYAKCNIGVNGTDGHGNTCSTGTYCCFCASAADPWGPPVPCNKTLGREQVRSHFGGEGRSCKAGSAAWECYKDALTKKLSAAQPGNWYSSREEGDCGASPVGTGGCTWRLVAVEKIVTLACHNLVYFGAVQAASPACFSGCGADATNSSAPCWVDCFYQTVLGAAAGTPGGAVGGMPLPTLAAAWALPFASSDPSKGGCPAVKPAGAH